MTPISKAVLRSNDLLRNAADAALERIASTAIRRHYVKGAVIFREGDPGDAVYGVIAGTVQVVSSTNDSREVFIDTVDAGKLFGDVAVLDGEPRCATARAATDLELFVISRQRFMELLSEEPGLQMLLLNVMCRRLRWSTELIHQEYASRDTPGRLAHRLLQLAEEGGRGSEQGVELQASQSDLGKHVFLSRQAVNQHLQTWQRLGVVSIGRGKLVIRDREALAAIAGAVPTDHGPPKAHYRHVAHFYESEEGLAVAVGAYLGQGLAAGEPVLVIATPAHARRFEAVLAEAGHDLPALRERGRLVFVDAEQALAQLMAQDAPCHAAFDKLIGTTVRELAGVAPPSGIRAYGEMVDLLWQQDNLAGARQLEELCQGLLKSHNMQVFCAYQADRADLRMRSSVAALHTHVV